MISRPLSFVINLSLSKGFVPNNLKIARVIPLHIRGSLDDISNYRPISILPVISKILERAVHDQLLKYLEQNKNLSKNQFGYRQKHSIELGTLYLVDEISKQIDNGNMVGALYNDLSKAFDTISYAILLPK